MNYLHSHRLLYILTQDLIFFLGGKLVTYYVDLMYHMSSIIIHQFWSKEVHPILFRLETDTNYLGFALYQSSILLLEFGAMLSNDFTKRNVSWCYYYVCLLNIFSFFKLIMLKTYPVFLIFLLWKLPLSWPEPLLVAGLQHTVITRTYGLPVQCGGIYLPKNIVC